MQDTPSTLKLERSLAMLGTSVCLILAVVIWRILSRQQPMWPLPDLYLLEMPVASALGMWGVWSRGSKELTRRGILIWAAAGVLLGFAIMGSFSIGFLYMPVAGLLAVAAVLSGRRQGGSLVLPLGASLAAAVAQAGLMLAVIRLLY